MYDPLCRVGGQWALRIHQQNLDRMVGSAHTPASPMYPPAFSAHLLAVPHVCTPSCPQPAAVDPGSP